MKHCIHLTGYVMIALACVFAFVVIGALLRSASDLEQSGTAGRQTASVFSQSR